jgi:hypothetical protein
VPDVVNQQNATRKGCRMSTRDEGRGDMLDRSPPDWKQLLRSRLGEPVTA